MQSNESKFYEMRGGGRPFHNYWDCANFERLRVNGRVQALCVICNKTLQNTAKSRLQRHRNICKTIEEQNRHPNLREKLLAESPNVYPEMKYEEMEHSEEEINESKLVVQNIQENQKIVLTSIEPFLDDCENSNSSEEQFYPTTSSDIARIHSTTDEAFAEFIFGCNVPLITAESPIFKHFVKSLNSSYTLPTTKQLLGGLLDRISEKYDCRAIIKNKEKTETVLLLTGFNHSNGVVACLQDNDGKRYFLNCWDFEGDISGEIDTPVENLNGQLARVTTILEECKQLALENFNSTIYAAVFDGLEIATTFDSILCTTCNCREADLLAADITTRDLIRNVVQILKEFRLPERESELIQKGGCKIVLPWDRKWCTYRETLQSFLKNYNIMTSMISSFEFSNKSQVFQTFLSEKFIAEIRTTAEALGSVCKLIYICQKKKTTLAEATEEWLRIKLPEKFKDSLATRKKAVLSPWALAANYVDPRYRGNLLSTDQFSVVEDFFLEHLSAEALDDLFVFKANAGIFKVMSDKDITTPTTYWGLAERKHPGFAKLAGKLVTIPASSSQLQKLYSEFVKVHAPVRHMMGLEKLRELLKVYFSLRFSSLITE